jgi:hypothetical protein
MPEQPASACVPRAARDYLRALAQPVEVDAQELRIMGSKSELLRTLVAASGAKTPSFWRAQFRTEMAHHGRRR